MPAWMLDPVACAGMKLGEPQIEVAALCDLRAILSGMGFGPQCFGKQNNPELSHGDLEDAKADDTFATQLDLRDEGVHWPSAAGAAGGDDSACRIIDRSEWNEGEER